MVWTEDFDHINQASEKVAVGIRSETTEAWIPSTWDPTTKKEELFWDHEKNTTRMSRWVC